MGFQVSGMRKVAASLQARGIKVTEVSGWTTRGRSTFEPRAVVYHWTVATRSITATLVHAAAAASRSPARCATSRCCRETTGSS